MRACRRFSVNFRCPAATAIFTLWLALSLVAIPSLALPRTWYVKPDGSGDAPTIQAAVDSASEGDIVLVAPGAYSDTSHVWIGDSLEVVNVHLYKNLKLLAEGDPSNTTIGWTQSDIAIYVSGVDSTCEIRGFRISITFDPYFCLDAARLSDEPDFWFAIKCDSAAVTIRNNAFVDNGICINLRASPALIENNSFLRGFAGIRCYAGSEATIRGNRFQQCGTFVLCEESSPEIVDNEITNGCQAVVCNAGGSAHIARNLISDMHTRALSCGEAAPLIEDNVFRENSEGVFLSSFTLTPIVRNNLFYDTGFTAIELLDNPNAVIENNTVDLVHDGQFGAITCQASATPVVRNNIITRAVKGILCLLSSSPTLECNNIYSTLYPYAGDCLDQTGLNGNLSLDPQFCGDLDSGNYRLQSDSPCAPGNHPDGYACGLIGAQDVGCGLAPTTQSSWGSIKSRFRKEDGKP